MIRRYTETPRDLLVHRWPHVETISHKLIEYVKPIIDDVQRRGDNAVREYTRRFDGVEIAELMVQPKELRAAYKEVTEGQVKALEELKRRLEMVETRRLNTLSFNVSIDGVDIECSFRPLNNVGCYVPGGKAAYPSSLMMNVVPARVAGVEKIIVCTPPRGGNRPPAITLVAADISGVDAVYKVGGIQAIASMAYGTESIPKVDKIVGPGNKYVTTAKMVISNIVAVDKPAGPSEVIVLADEAADAKLIALDMISQAEHGKGGVSGLITTSSQLSVEVENKLKQLIGGIPREEVVRESLSESGFIYTARTIDEAILFVNLFSPEHLEIHTENPKEISKKISTAGLVQIGSHTPVASTDYCMGVNHVLPTNGYTRISSGITVLDYLRSLSIVEASRSGLEKIRDHVRVLAEAEGLPNHLLAVEGRFNYET